MYSVLSMPKCAVLIWHHINLHQWKHFQVRTTVSEYRKKKICQCAPYIPTPHFAFKTFTY